MTKVQKNLGTQKRDNICIPLQNCDGESMKFLVQSHEIYAQWKVSGNAALT